MSRQQNILTRVIVILVAVAVVMFLAALLIPSQKPTAKAIAELNAKLERAYEYRQFRNDKAVASCEFQPPFCVVAPINHVVGLGVNEIKPGFLAGPEYVDRADEARTIVLVEIARAFQEDHQMEMKFENGVKIPAGKMAEHTVVVQAWFIDRQDPKRTRFIER